MLPTIVLSLSCAIQFVAAGLALRLVPTTRERLAWALLASAFLLMAIRRGMALYGVVVLENAPRATYQELVALLISCLCMAGIATIPSLFRQNRDQYERLHGAEERLQRILEASPVGIFVTDVSGRILLLNPAAREMFALGEDFDPEKRPILYPNLIDESDREDCIESGHRIMRSGGLSRNTYLCRRGHADSFYGEISRALIRDARGGPSMVVVTVKDTTDLRLTMEQLREERDRADHYLDIVNDIIVVLDVSGRVTLVNRRGLQILGVSLDEVFWKDWFQEYLPDRDQEEGRARFREATAGDGKGPSEFKSGLRSLGSRVLTIRWRMIAIQNRGGAVVGVICSGEDVTAQQAAETALREQQRTMETLLSNLPGMAYRCLNVPEWTMKYVSKGALDLTGYMPRDLMNNRTCAYADLIEPEHVDLVWRSVQQALEHGRPFRISYPIRTRSGERRWVWEQGRGVFNAEGAVEWVEGFIADVTQQKLAEDSLRRERDFKNNLIETSPVYYCALDPQGRIMMVNRAMLESMGYRRKDLIGKHFLDVFLSQEDRTLFADVFQSLLTEASATWKVERLLTADGRERVVEWHGRAVYRDEGDVDFAFGLGIDITERTHLERQQLDHQRDLEALNESLRERNRELDEFTFIVSHDLQEPVRKQIMFGEVLRDSLHGEQSEDTSFALDAIVSSAERMRALVLGLLALSRSRRQALRLSTTSLDECLDRAIETLSVYIEDHGGVTFHRSPLPSLEADPVLMTQVFQNLLSNALKFCDKSSTVIQVDAATCDGMWQICFADNGIGIAPDYLEQVFAPFKRLHAREEYEGTGIGLAICRKIVERHHGRIWAESEAGQGTRIRMDLPAESEATAHERDEAMGTAAGGG